MYIAGMIILVFFAVIGLGCFLSGIAKRSLKSGCEGMILLIPSIDEATAEAHIRSAAVIRQDMQGCRVVCVCGEDDPARVICETLRREYPFLEIVSRFDAL